MIASESWQCKCGGDGKGCGEHGVGLLQQECQVKFKDSMIPDERSCRSLIKKFVDSESRNYLKCYESKLSKSCPVSTIDPRLQLA